MSVANLVSHAAACNGKNLAQCATYFSVSNPNVAWCAWFARMCGSRSNVNMNFGSSDFAADLKGTKGNFAFKAGAQGTTSNKPKVGDLLFIQPAGKSGISHVGICNSVDPNGNIKSWEGNMSGTTSTSTVKEASYPYNSGESSSWGKIINYGSNS
jgi:hypothetical protein